MTYYKIRFKDRNRFYAPYNAYYPQTSDNERKQQLTERQLTNAIEHIQTFRSSQEQKGKGHEYCQEENIEVIEYIPQIVSIRTVTEASVRDKKKKSE